VKGFLLERKKNLKNGASRQTHYCPGSKTPCQETAAYRSAGKALTH
jgi:hypothetical protein